MFTKWTAIATAALMITTSPIAIVTSQPVFAQETVASEQQQEKATLDEVTAQSERLVAALIRASRLSEDEALGLGSETGKPYWSALRSLNSAIQKMANGAALRDETFHEGLSETIREGTAMIASYELSGATDEKVEKAIEAIEENVTVLYDAFSKAADRARRGGELTEAERERLAKAQEQQVELQRRLDAMEAKVKDNKRALEGLREVRKRSREISGYRSNVGDFLAAMVALRVLDGLIWGCHPWWGIWGGWYPGWSIVIIDIHDGYYDDYVYDWDYYGDVAIDYDLAAFEDSDLLLDDTEMMDNLDFIEDAEIDFDGSLAEPLLEDLEVPTEDDFADEDLGLDEAMLDDGVEGLEFESPVDDIGEIGEIDINEPLVEDMAPLVEDAGPLFDQETPFVEDAMPMDLGSGGDSFQSFESYENFDSFDSFDGGGFDDLGGFDDW